MPTLNPNVASQQSRWHVFADASELEQQALQRILTVAQEAITARGAFHLVLAGGTTPRRIYEQLASAKADWFHWHIYFGDERCLPANHAERNSHMAATVWLDHVAIPAAQIHPIQADLGAEIAAHAYAAVLKPVAEFDLVLLGLGEDGHTASLFPLQEWERAVSWPPVLPVHDAPKPPPDRVSLSPQRLSDSRQVLFLVTGAGKARAVRDWRDGIAIPASRIDSKGGVDIYADLPAMS
ncbi:MAG TPA: 6-phosphogluconolactonase [Rhodocyclaceae bacterium]|nr:6-phosphogluconolactonase [Rhodocyclaceae bacterium]